MLQNFSAVQTEEKLLFSEVKPINKEHFKLPFEEQTRAHNNAELFLKGLNIETCLINPIEGRIPSFAELQKSKTKLLNLDSKYISWENTKGVDDDIQNSAKVMDEVHIYGVASQFNGCEAMSRYTILPGKAYDLYQSDPTQGPRAQLQFSRYQVEALNASANLGFNGLIDLLDESTKSCVRHGYFSPDSEESLDIMVDRLQKNGDLIKYIAAKSVPELWGWTSKSQAKWNKNKPQNTQDVHECLVAAPALGMYSMGTFSNEKMQELQFLCAARAMQAQLRYALKIRKETPNGKVVVFKPTSPGLGVFGNEVEPVAMGYAFALNQFSEEVEDFKGNLVVRLQVYQSRGSAKQLADALNLQEHKSKI